MIRRLTLTALAATLALPAFAQGEIHVYNWSDYIAEDTVAKFEAATGIKVVYDVYDSNEVLEAKLLAGSSGYDVVVPTSQFLQRQIGAGVYQPLDKSKLPNLANMDPGLMEKAAAYDAGNEHAIIWMWGTTGIGYNVNAVEERLGADAPVDSWALIFDPANAEKLADCGISMLDSSTDILPSALAYLGLDPTSSEPRTSRRRRSCSSVDPALRPLLPFVAVHLRPRERRDLRRGRLLRRHLHRRGPGGAGRHRRRDRLLGAEGGRAAVVRHGGDPGRRAEPGGGARVPELRDGPADQRRHHQLRLVRQRQRRLDADGRSRRSPATRRSSRPRRCWPSCSRRCSTTPAPTG